MSEHRDRPRQQRGAALSRRGFLGATGAVAATMSAEAVSGRAAFAGVPEAPTQTSPAMQPPLFPTSGPGLPAGRDAERLDAALAHER